MFCIWRMPVPTPKHRLAAGQKFADQTVQWGNDLVAMGHSERPAMTKIVLNINDYECSLLLLSHIIHALFLVSSCPELYYNRVEKLRR